ncbi:tripartite tricarboxylate transporter substrate binding protein [Bradyrhizobium sp. WD16]|uniref:Bug family tripartite tricarboxylate transporter substrate binding protein n=1 Tax=Bradyrhizobium sp. WD16 TaxID=1521768 RepID=UPI0020A47B4B|nr:tripartite tricarboxylate transporter substrate binding protein [Bradyrhizobium sp. WD16]UTD29456.1 ABC transporter substrate-binding protein [Bradyrhizobium sp. WD16]
MIKTASAAIALLLLATAPLAAQTAGHTAGQDWPTRSVRIIVPFAPGSTPDMVGRVLAEDLQARHPGINFIVENKPGASGNTGTDVVARAEPDGSTIGISLGGPLAINALLFSKLPYDPDRDIAPITMLTALPSVLVVPTSLGVNSVAEFVALLKKDAGKFSYASIGAGSLSQLCMEAIGQKAGGGRMVHVPYGSSPQAVTAVIRGDVQAACVAAIAVTPQLASGAVKILAVTTPKRSVFLPDVPTLKESGVDVESDAWNALIAPAGTPPAIIARINAEVGETLRKSEVREKLRTQLIEPVPSTPEEVKARMAAEKKLWADVIKASEIRIN